MTDFRINVIVDPGPAVSGTKKVVRGLDRVEDRARRVRRALGQAFLLAGLGAGLAGTIGFLADYSQQLSTVGAVASATAEELRALDAEFKQLGASTRFSASQAAEGAVFLARAGFEATEVLESLEDTLRLAQAGALGLGRAADIASNVLTGFRLPVSEAGRVVDVLASAANSANTDVDQLGQALKFVAPVAAGLGVTLEETTATIQALSNAGLQATLAGTGLRRILSELESPSTKTEGLLRELGLTTDDVRVSQVGLTAALQALANAGVDTGLALELFGDRGGPAFEVLRNAIPDIQASTAALRDARGEAARIAKEMDDNLNGALLQVKSAFQGLLLAFGDIGSVDALESTLNGLSSTLRFLGENAEITALAIATFVGSLVAARVSAFVSGIVASTTAFLELQTAVAAGNAVILGSAEATRQQAIAELTAAEATVVNTAAQITNTQALAAKRIALGATAEGIIRESVLIAELNVLEAQNVVATNAVAVAHTRLATATAAAAVKGSLLNAVFKVNPFIILVTGLAAATIAFTSFSDSIAISEEIKGLATGIAILAVVLGTVYLVSVLTSTAATAAFAAALAAVNTLIKANLIGLLLSGLVLAGFAFASLNRDIRDTNDELEELEKRDPFRPFSEIEVLEDQLASLVGELSRFNDLDPLIAFGRALDGLRVSKDIRADIEELEEALQNLRLASSASLTGQGLDLEDDVQAVIDALEEENMLLGENAREFGIKIDLLRQIKKLEADTEAEVTPDQEAALELAIRENENLRDRAELLEQIKGPLREFELANKNLNILLKEGEIDKDELNEQLAQMILNLDGIDFSKINLRDFAAGIEGLDLSDLLAALDGIENANIPVVFDNITQAANVAAVKMNDATIAAARFGTVFQGLEAGFARVENRLLDVASVASDVVVNGFQSAEDAIVNFVTGSEDAFKGLINSILADLSRLATRGLVSNLFSALSGGIPDSEVSAFNSIFSGREHGGRVAAGEIVEVGEGGRELFMSDTAGTIIPNRQTEAILAGGGAQQAPIVNVAPANVSVAVLRDPDEIADFLQSEEGLDLIVNAAEQKRPQFRSALGLQ